MMGEWEIVIVENISPTHTEVEIIWGSGAKEWLSLEDSTRIANFQTMTASPGEVSLLPCV
jgi:hypothetical protein